MSHNVLDILNLEVGFHSALIKNIDASIAEGELVALMGVNGAGKSCLLKTLSGLIHPLSGQMNIHTRNYQTFSQVELARMIAVVLTERFQSDFLRVNELVALGRSPYTNWLGRLEERDEKIIQDVMEIIGIRELSDSLFSELSDGQKQKALIARAVVQEPSLLILDEPTTFLDIPSKVELMKLLKAICECKKTGILFSSHDLDVVEKFADKIWLVSGDGKLVSKSPKEMRSSGLLDEVFKLKLNEF
jgi:iron complex transport system ATP-binding protein